MESTKSKLILKIVPQKEKIDNDWSLEKLVQEYIPPHWESVFESSKDELKDVSDILEKDKVNGKRVPYNTDIFRIFYLVPPNKVKVVLVGMDPYINVMSDGTPQAVGMSFSVPRDCQPLPPSLKNIYKVMKETMPDFVTPNHGDLTLLALKGVFLLNACLTTRLGESGSHGSIWSGFIKKVITKILDVNPNVIFLLWGKQAQALKKMIGGRGTILETSHPCPMSARLGFFTCNHFNLVNEILIKQGQTPIDWNID